MLAQSEALFNSVPTGRKRKQKDLYPNNLHHDPLPGARVGEASHAGPCVRRSPSLALKVCQEVSLMTDLSFSGDFGGFAGVRVGEAAAPGPGSRKSSRLADHIHIWTRNVGGAKQAWRLFLILSLNPAVIIFLRRRHFNRMSGRPFSEKL